MTPGKRACRSTPLTFVSSEATVNHRETHSLIRINHHHNFEKTPIGSSYSHASKSMTTVRRRQGEEKQQRCDSVMNPRSLASIKLLSATANEQMISINTMTLLISLAVLLFSSFAMVASATLHASSGLQDFDPRRVAFESELASLLMQPSESGSKPQSQQDWREKALASAIISHIMLDNLTNPCDGSPGGCGIQAQNVENIQLGPATSNEAVELQQHQREIDEDRFRLLLEQLQILNQQANTQDGAASSSNEQQGEFVISTSGRPADQIANIKRATSNRFQPKLHMRGLAGGESPVTIPNSPVQWAPTMNANGHGAHELSLGSLKRPDSGSILRLGDGSSYMKRPSSNNRQFEFGLGKRVASPSYSRYDFGLGKRASGNQFQEYRYDFGLGK